MKRHSFAHLVLIVALFVIAALVFHGAGPLSGALQLGAMAYGMFATGSAGNLDAAQALSAGLVPLILVFLINLVIYYVISSLLIFLFNLVFGRG